jgi:hypothetical protein
MHREISVVANLRHLSSNKPDTVGRAQQLSRRLCSDYCLRKRWGFRRGGNGHKTAKLSLCLTNYALPHKDVWGRRCIDPLILHNGTSWKLVVIFTHLPLYSLRNSSHYPLDRRLSSGPLTVNLTGTQMAYPVGTGDSFAGGEGSGRGREADHSPPTNTEVRTGGSVSSLLHTSLCMFM